MPDEELLALHEVLTRLEAIDPQQSKVVELRFFGGLTMEETAEVLHISPATVGREWTLAKAWLYAELTRTPGVQGATLVAQTTSWRVWERF